MSERVKTTITDPRLAQLYKLHIDGELVEAEEGYRAFLTDRPDHAEAWHLLGLVKAARGDVQEGIRSIQRAMELKPDEARYRNNLGHLFRTVGRMDDAYRELEEAIKLRPIFPGAHYNMGLVLHARGHVSESETHFKMACAQDSSYVQAHYWLGLVRQDLGDLASARECFERAVELKPDYVPAIYQLAFAHKVSSDDDPLLLRVQSLALGGGGTYKDRMLVHFALGKLYDDLGDYEAAASEFHDANAHFEGRFDARLLAARVQAMREAFPKGFFSAHAARGSNSQKPVFIVGMPRSGSTLLSQIIHAHPRASSAGERSDLPELVGQLESEKGSALPNWVGQLDEATLKRIATTYLSRLTRGFPDSLRVVDKMPGNWQVLGMIALLFPGARIIVSEREPKAMAWSCYTHKFDHGQSFSYDLENIALYYHLYRQLMDHWEKVLPTQIHTVRYEDLVEDQEKVSRELIEFLGLEWDERCLRFFESDSIVTSASSRQVRQPIHGNALERWRNYEPVLERFEARLNALRSG